MAKPRPDVQEKMLDLAKEGIFYENLVAQMERKGYTNLFDDIQDLLKSRQLVEVAYTLRGNTREGSILFPSGTAISIRDA